MIHSITDTFYSDDFVITVSASAFTVAQNVIIQSKYEHGTDLDLASVFNAIIIIFDQSKS